MILLPRPAPQLAESLAILRAQGITNILPFAISHIEPLHPAIPASTTLLILTSSHATGRPFPSMESACVGAATARAAARSGLRVTHTGDSDGPALAAHLAKHLTPGQHIVHLHSSEADLSWHQQLTAVGHTVTSLIAYRTTYANTLPPEVATAFSNNTITHTLLLSSGGTRHLLNLLQQATIAPCGKALALSHNIAQIAQAAFPQIQVSPNTSLESLLTLLPPQAANVAA